MNKELTLLLHEIADRTVNDIERMEKLGNPSSEYTARVIRNACLEFAIEYRLDCWKRETNGVKE